MSDLAKLLDVTEPVECEFMGKTIVAHVYTAGVNRLTREQRLVWETIEAQDNPDGIEWARALLPAMISAWELEGTPMELRGQPFPPTDENMKQCPDLLLNAVTPKVLEVWNKANPTNGGQPPNGSQPEGKPESNPTETTLLESKSP